MGKKKKNRGEKECKILVLVWVVRYLSIFISPQTPQVVSKHQQMFFIKISLFALLA
jgi:hypothetical protein